ncbi:hypothetical protein MARI_13770 [Marinobacter sp. JH2]|nr:hypothetical protein MARI_13770 [Marinobacter sp. JH2]
MVGCIAEREGFMAADRFGLVWQRWCLKEGERFMVGLRRFSTARFSLLNKSEPS